MLETLFATHYGVALGLWIIAALAFLIMFLVDIMENGGG